jgi:hypothetical protein
MGAYMLDGLLCIVKIKIIIMQHSWIFGGSAFIGIDVQQLVVATPGFILRISTPIK